MNIEQRTSNFLDLIHLSEADRQDLYAKYSLLADTIVVSASKEILKKNSTTYSVLLSKNLIDYMTMLYNTGNLQSLIASNPNIGKILNPKSQSHLAIIANSLLAEGWSIPNEVTASKVIEALQLWSNEKAKGVTGAKVISDDEFGDIDIDDLFGEDEDEDRDDGEPAGFKDEPDDEFDLDDDEEIDIYEESPTPVQMEDTSELFKGTVPEIEFDVADSDDFEDDDEDEYIDISEPEIKYDPKILRAEIDEAKAIESVSNTLNNTGNELDTPDWAQDSEGDTDGLNDLPGEIDSTITSIIQRIEGVMRSCFELDRPYGAMTEKGLMKYHTDPSKKTLIIDSPKSQAGLSEMEILFRTIINCARVKVTTATDPRYVPNYANITGKSTNTGSARFDYYPGQMLKYALGFVNGKKHTSWKAFEKELRASLKARLNEFYKKEVDGVSEYYLYREKLVQIYSNCLLVLSYSSAGMTIRTSLIGMSDGIAESIKESLKKVSSMSNSTVTVLPVAGYRDVVDIQIMGDIETVMGKPAWAYKALKVKLDNGEAPSLSSGLPIGKKLNGEIVEFKLDPSSRFMIFVAAGSGSGKGVLTLSMTAAALGSDIPLFYMDYKPDMAPIFWEMGKKLGTESFIFDANVKAHKNDMSTGYILGGTIPEKLKSKLAKHTSALMYLRAIAIMCAMSNRRAQNDHETNDDGMLFVFDEIQTMQKLIINAIIELQMLYDENSPTGKKADDSDEEIYNYCKKVLSWIVDVDAALSNYINTTGRVSGIYTMFIGQNATANVWNSLETNIRVGKKGKPVSLLAMILKAGTVTKLLGKGTSSSVYGLSGANITSDESGYITKYRYFALYDGPTATNAGEVSAFKPFLTLNYDDIFAKCWTKGVGKTYGFKQPPTKDPGRTEIVAANQEYVENMQKAFPGESGYSNEYGVHPGVGLLGLASMYCGGNIQKLSSSFGKSREATITFFNRTGLNKRYSCPEEYMYDMTADAWLSQNQMLNYTGESMDFAEDIQDGENGGTGLFMDGFSEGLGEAPEQRATVSDMSFQPASNIINPATPPISREAAEMIRRKQEWEAAQQYGESITPSARPDEMRPDEHSTFAYGGDTGKTLYITPDKTSHILGLTKENSVVVTIPSYDTTEKFQNRLFKTLWGTQYEFKNRWRAILDGVADTTKADLVTRFVALEDTIVFNKKQVATLNILGGDADIRIEDLVNFKQTARKFKNISEITLDETIFERAQIEFGEPIAELFKCFSRLQKLTVMTAGCGSIKVDISRSQFEQGRIETQAKELSNRATYKNQLETISATKNHNLKRKSPGYQNKVWEASKNFQGKGWKAVGDALLDRNPKLFRAVGLSALTIGVLGVGAVFGLTGRIWNMFGR